MNQTISFTIPNDPKIIKATANALLEMAGVDYAELETKVVACVTEAQKEPVIVPLSQYGDTKEGGPATVIPGNTHPMETTDPVKLFGEPSKADPNTGESTSVETAPTEQTQPTPELDRDGIPWDARIHSSNGKLTATGQWQKRRGLDPLTYETIKAELKANQSTPVPSAPSVGMDASLPQTPDDVVKYLIDKGIGADKSQAAAVKVGLTNFAGIYQRPDLIPAFMEAIRG